MDFPFGGALFTKDWMVYLVSYRGLLFDLLIVPLLLWRWTCRFAYRVRLSSHELAVAATTLFLTPSLPWRFVGFLRGLP